ncbi:MAG: response regulator [Betaproteobacteria bacterium]|nr:response regulator [Betaproteobacteria bacterium]
MATPIAVSAASGRKSKILAIDDDAAVTDYLQANLGGTFDLVVTNDPGEALEMARRERPDLVLCDVSMPEIDGYELCRRIKADADLGDTPVILLTASRTEAGDEKRGLEAGSVDYLNKTLDRAVLQARLRLHLALRDAQGGMRDQNALLEASVAARTAELEASRLALREAMHNLRTTRVAPGVYWIQVPEAGLYILCGTPGDVVKNLMLRGYIAEERKGSVLCETGPNVILLSDVLLQNGRFANLSEFPVLQMLYRQGMILPGHPNNTGRKPLIIGASAQVRAQLDYIYRGNYGLVSEEEMRAAGIDGDEARRQMALKLRFAFGSIRSSEDLLDSRVIGKDPVELANGVSARRLGLNRYEFAYQGRNTEVDLNLAPDEAYEAPYTPGQHFVAPQYFGVIHCGEGDGWDLRRQSMASIVMFQGRYYLVDAGPSVLHTLQSLGIDVSEIAGVFHTHAHDDHFAGLPALIASGVRLRYYATPLVRHSVTKKLAALMSIDEALFADFFEVRDLVAGQWNDCDGMEVMPVASPHPVETTVFTFRVRGDEGYRTYAHLADIVALDVLARLVAAPEAREALPADFVDSVRAAYLTPATVKKIDAGGGLIHGAPVDFSHDKSEKIVLAHRAEPFTAGELEVGSQATFGAVDVLIASSQDYIWQRAYLALSRLFPEAGLESLNALLRSPVTIHNAGSLILRRGAESRHVYLVLTGSVELHDPQNPPPAVLPVGSLIGVDVLFNDAPLPATWRAASTVRLLRMNVNALRDFVLNGGWYGGLRMALDSTAPIRALSLFAERIDLQTQQRIAAAMERVVVGAGAVIPPGDALQLVRRGQVRLETIDGRLLETVGEGGCFSEESCLGRTAPVWHAVALGAVELSRIPAATLRTVPIVLLKLLEIYNRRLCVAQLDG